MLKKEYQEILVKRFEEKEIPYLEKQNKYLEYHIGQLAESKNIEKFNNDFMDFLKINDTLTKIINKKRKEKELDEYRFFLMGEYGNLSYDELKGRCKEIDEDLICLVNTDMRTFNDNFWDLFREYFFVLKEIKNKNKSYRSKKLKQESSNDSIPEIIRKRMKGVL